MGVSFFGAAAPENFATFDAAFMTLFYVTGGDPWPDTLPKHYDDGTTNWQVAGHADAGALPPSRRADSPTGRTRPPSLPPSGPLAAGVSVKQFAPPLQRVAAVAALRIAAVAALRIVAALRSVEIENAVM